jgi:hypothetical protein
MKDVWKQSSIMNFEVQASFVGQSKNLFQDKSNIFYEKWINKRVNDFPMFISWILVENNMILNKKMRHIVVKIYIFRNGVQTNQLRPAANSETIIF